MKGMATSLERGRVLRRIVSAEIDMSNSVETKKALKKTLRGLTFFRVSYRLTMDDVFKLVSNLYPIVLP